MRKRQLDDYATLNFGDFFDILVQNKLHLLNFLSTPGIYGIHCFATNKTSLRETYCVLRSMRSNFEDILSQLFEGDPQLLDDFNRYGLDEFAFVIINNGSDWKSSSKREETLFDVENSWPYKLYKNN